MSDLSPIEYLYGTYTAEDADGYIRTRVIPFRIAKKTAKRIFYVREYGWGCAEHLGSVNRQILESTGEVYSARAPWAPDGVLYAEPPELLGYQRVDLTALKEELSRLRVEMANVHPDGGGTDAEFIAAHKRYVSARDRFHRLLGHEVPG